MKSHLFPSSPASLSKLRRVLCLLLAGCFWIAAGTSGQAGTGPNGEIHPLNDGNAAADLNSGGVGDSQRGWRFKVNASVTVTELGSNNPKGSGVAYSLVIWRVSTQTQVARIDMVSNGPAQWQWQNLPAPVVLAKDEEYIVSMYSGSEGAYYFGSAGGAPAWYPTGTIQYLDMRYANSATVDTFPMNVLSNIQYGVPDFGYVLTGSTEIVVTTKDDVVDANDGLISLREALAQGAALGGTVKITFDPALKGQVIRLTSTLSVSPGAFQSLTVEGDIDGDGKPDITISGDANSDDTLTTVGTYSVTDVGASNTAGTMLGNVRLFDVAANVNLTLDGLVLTGGLTGGNGGALNCNGNVTLTNSILAGNSANLGAAIYNQTGNSTFTNVVIVGNSANEGGGLYINASSPTLTNVVIAGNFALNSGAMVINGGSNPTLTNVTVSGNSDVNGTAAIFNGNGSPQFRNCILWGDATGEFLNSTSGATTFSNCLVQGSSAQFFFDGVYRIDGGGNLDSDPKFVAGFGTAPSTGGDLRLRNTSPALDKGSDTVANPALPATDLAGNARILGTHVDMGAYEWVGSLIVKNTNDSGPDSLRDVIARIGFGGTVTFSDGTGGTTDFQSTPQTITLTTGSITIANDIAISGPGASKLTLDAGHQSRILNFNYVNATLSGLTMINGNGDGGNGGAILNNGYITLNDCVLSGNSSGNAGGAVFNEGYGSASLTLVRCTISGNSAAFGGAIFNQGYNYPAVTVRDSTLSGNTASLGGGAFYNHGNGGIATLTIIDSTVAANSAIDAGAKGGAIANDGDGGQAYLTIANSTLAGNTAATAGGIYNIGNPTAGLTIGNTILAKGATGANYAEDLGATTNSLGYNISDDASTTFLTASGDRNNVDPKLQKDPNDATKYLLANNGGPTQTVIFLAGSPALDGGNPSFDSNSFTPALTADQRGQARVTWAVAAGSGPRVDIGAFEAQPPAAPTFAVGPDGVTIDLADGPYNLTNAAVGAMPPGGVFSGVGVSNGIFDPTKVAPGTYTIYYAVPTGESGALGIATFVIHVTSSSPFMIVVATSAPDGSGSDVPGEPAGTKFTKFGLPSVCEPAGGGGSSLLGARVGIKPPGGTEVPAILINDVSQFIVEAVPIEHMKLAAPPQAHGILARAGDAAPDGAGGTFGTFASFQEPVFGAGSVAFGATLTGTGVTKANDTGLWSTVTGQLDLVAAEGGPVPDTEGIHIVGAVFEKIQSYVISADGQVSFLATVKGTGVKASNKTGVWQYRSRFNFNNDPIGFQLRQVIRTGDIYSITTDFNKGKSQDQPIKSLTLFVPAKTIPGQRRSYAGRDGQLFTFAKFLGSHQALLCWNDNGYNFNFNSFRLENTTVGHPGLPSMNSDGYFAMRAGLSLGAVLANNPSVKISAKNDQTILTGRNQFQIGILCQEGSPVSSVNPEVFTAFDEPAFNDNYDTAFFAKVKSPTTPASQQRVLIYDGIESLNYAPTVIARTGVPAADLGAGILWKDFTAMVLPDSGFGPVFLGKLTGSGVTKTNDLGLWATNTTGTVLLLLRTGDTVTIGGVNKTVSLINTLGAALDSPGQGRYVDRQGHISAQLTFTDGSTALVLFALPTPPVTP